MITLKTIKISAACALASLTLCFPPSSWAGSSKKLSADTAPVTSQAMVQVIIQWNSSVGSNATAKVEKLGGTVVRDLKLINGGTYLIPGAALSQLQNDPDVKYISLDRPVKSKLDYTAAAVNAGAAIDAGISGSGVGVAVIDSGTNSSVNLSSLAYSEDFTGTTKGKPGADLFGHGQHVAGIIASNSSSTINKGKATRTFLGIAPGVTLVNLRVLDANGSGSDSNVIAAIQRAIELKSSYNIRIINLSLGRPVSESYTLDPLCQAVEAAWKSGLVVVVAAGNEGRTNTFGNAGYGTITAPGNDPYVITVGAMKAENTYSRTDDLMASYSSKGPTQIDHIVKPDIVAPGNQVVSLLASNSTLLKQNPDNAVIRGYYLDVNNNKGQKVSQDFFMLSGTSMAAPVVSGAAADLLQINPSLTPDQIKALLMQTAYKTFPLSSIATDSQTGQSYTSYYDIFTVGAGYLDIGAAIAAINRVPAVSSALSPTAVYDSTTGSVSMSFDMSSVFTNQAVWGSQSVWGSSVLDTANQAVWGNQSVWGTTTDAAQQAVWGTQSVWGTSSTSLSEASAVTLTGEN